MKKSILISSLYVLLIIVFLPMESFAKVTKADVTSSSVQAMGGENGFIRHSNGKNEVVDSSFKALYINGSLIQNANIITENSRTLVPIRLISEKMGALVSWDDKTRKVTIKNDTVTIELVINQKSSTVNNKEVLLDTAPKIYNNYTYLPLRFVSENLDSSVAYYDPNINPRTDGILEGIPTVFIDSKNINETQISKDEAKKIAINKCSVGYNNFKGSFKSGLEEKEHLERMNLIKKDIDNISYICDISRFYRFTGPYDILVDKYTKDVYFIIPGYSTIVTEVNVNDKNLYLSGYFAS